MKIVGSFPNTRLRRLRKHKWIRNIVSENNISHNDLILPVFVREGKNKIETIKSMPGVKRYSIDKLDVILKQVKKYRTQDTPESYRKTRVVGLEYEKNKIICDSIRRKTLHINVDGDVYPCCYIGNEYTRALRYNNDKDNIIATDRNNNYPLIQELDNIKLNNLSFYNIIKGKFYKEDLPESIKSYETAHQICQLYCSY